jgi:hypothetical protein
LRSNSGCRQEKPRQLFVILQHVAGLQRRRLHVVVAASVTTMRPTGQSYVSLQKPVFSQHFPLSHGTCVQNSAPASLRKYVPGSQLWFVHTLLFCLQHSRTRQVVDMHVF